MPKDPKDPREDEIIERFMEWAKGLPRIRWPLIPRIIEETTMTTRNFDISGHQIEVNIESVEQGGPHCAPSVDYEIIGELPEEVSESEVHDKVVDSVKEEVRGYPYRR